MSISLSLSHFMATLKELVKVSLIIKIEDIEDMKISLSISDCVDEHIWQKKY